MMAIKQQERAVEPPVVRYEYNYSYDFQPKKTTTALPLKNDTRESSPLNLLSSAASAIVDDVESSSLSSSSSSSSSSSKQQQEQPQVIRSALPSSSSPPPLLLKKQGLHQGIDRSRHVPVAFAVRRSAPSSFSLGSSSPKLPPAATETGALPHQRVLAVFPQYPPPLHGHSHLPMPPGMEMTLSHPAAKQQTTIPAIRTGFNNNSNKVTGRAASAFVPKAAKRQNSKYKMKYHYVSMKRSEAFKYIEELSRESSKPQYYFENKNHPKNHHQIPLPWNQHGSPVHPLPQALPAAVSSPIAVSIRATIYRLPLVATLVPRY